MYIYHSGIKGQRKGVRRYQFANGTYTEAGNQRYRPNKGVRTAKKIAIAATAGEIGIIAAKTGTLQTAKAAVSSAISKMGSMSLSNTSNYIAAAKSAIAAIPTPIKAIALPIIAIHGSQAAVKLGRDIYENRYEIKNAISACKHFGIDKAAKFVKDNGITLAVGAALSVIQSSPVPIISSATLAVLNEIMEHS